MTVMIDQKFDIRDQNLATMNQQMDEKMDEKLHKMDEKMDEKLLKMDEKMDEKLLKMDDKIDHRFKILSEQINDLADFIRKRETKNPKFEADLESATSEVKTIVVQLLNNHKMSFQDLRTFLEAKNMTVEQCFFNDVELQ
ncbi:hypothetical protein GEMRC1_008310 [Eukaryota sp. GEM-RC1]